MIPRISKKNISVPNAPNIICSPGFCSIYTIIYKITRYLLYEYLLLINTHSWGFACIVCRGADCRNGWGQSAIFRAGGGRIGGVTRAVGGDAVGGRAGHAIGVACLGGCRWSRDGRRINTLRWAIGRSSGPRRARGREISIITVRLGDTYPLYSFSFIWGGNHRFYGEYQCHRYNHGDYFLVFIFDTC